MSMAGEGKGYVAVFVVAQVGFPMGGVMREEDFNSGVVYVAYARLRSP